MQEGKKTVSYDVMFKFNVEIKVLIGEKKYCCNYTDKCCHEHASRTGVQVGKRGIRKHYQNETR